jgi:hypothetical protein
MVLLCVTYIAAPVMFSAITKGPATRYTRPTSDSFAYFTQQEKERGDQRVWCLDVYSRDTIAVSSSSNLFWLGKKREAKSEHTLWMQCILKSHQIALADPKFSPCLLKGSLPFLLDR